MIAGPPMEKKILLAPETPPAMNEMDVSFYSDGVKLNGILYLPEGYDGSERLPAIIVNSGYTGLNAIYPRLFAQALTQAGYTVLGFDFRGCGESEGVRGRFILEEQVRDIQHALAFLKEQDTVDNDRIGIIGWGMAGGLVVDVASKEPEVKAVAALNGFFDGKAFYRYAFPGNAFAELERRIVKERAHRVVTGELTFTNPFEGYPLDPDTADVVNDRLLPVKNYEITVSFEIAGSIMGFNALERVDRLDCPLFVAHGEDNRLHPIEQSKRLYEMATVPKHFYTIDGKHNDFMTYGHPGFQELARELIAWCDDVLK